MAGVTWLRVRRGLGFHSTDEPLRAPLHKHTHTHDRASTNRYSWQAIPQSQTSMFSRTKWRRLNQSGLGLHTFPLVGKHILYIQAFFHTSLRSTTFSLLISPVVKSAVAVLRKSVITTTKPFTGNQNEVPDGKAFCCVPAVEWQWSFPYIYW